MTFYMNQYDILYEPECSEKSLNVLGATLGMVASRRPERWARDPGPGPLEAEGRLFLGMGPLHGPLGPLALKKI